jgi:hypothetical protein
VKSQLRRRSITKTATFAVVVITVLCGCGAAAHAHAAHAPIAAQIRISTFDSRSQRRKDVRFILRCVPASGSMPEAARLCGDIANHPSAMLAPAPSRSVCGGLAFGPIVYVHGYWRGRWTTFSGEPGCGWPGGTALAVYWAASRGDTRALALLEPRLRCDDDPVLLAKPTPWRSVFACTHGLWTPRTAKLIRIAETLPQIAVLQPRAIFPTQIGVKRCLMSAGGPRNHLLGGYCEVNVKRVWKEPQVSLTESWPAGKKIARHTWMVSVIKGKPRLASEHGAAPPQRWD